MDQSQQHIDQPRSFVILKPKYTRKRKSLLRKRPPTRRVSTGSGSSGTPIRRRISHPEPTPNYDPPRSLSSEHSILITKKRVRFSATNEYFLLSSSSTSSTNSDSEDYVDISEQYEDPFQSIETRLSSLDESLMLGPSPSPEPSTGSPQKVNRIPESSQTAKPALKRRSFIQRAPTSLGSGPASTMLFVSRVSATATLALPVEYGSLISYEPGMASPNFSKLGSGGFDIQYSTDAKEHEAKLGEIGLGGEDAREHVERTIPPSGNSGSTNLGDSDDSDMESLPPKSIPHPYAPTRHSPSVKANFFGDGKALLAGHPAPLRVSTGFEPGKLFTHRDSNPNLNTSGSDPPVRGSTSHGYPVPIPGYDFGVSKTGERFPLASSPIFSTDSDSDEEIQISEKYRLPNITPLPLEPGSSSGPSYRKRKLGLLLGPKMTSEGNGSQKRSRSDDDKDPLGLLSFSLRGKEKQRDKPVRGAHE